MKSRILVLLGLVCFLSCRTRSSLTETKGTDAGVKPGTTDADVMFDILDMSFLLPFPTSNFEIKASDAGPRGVIFDKRFLTDLPSEFLNQTHAGIDDLYGKIRIVAIRVDPCFPRVPEDDDAKKCIARPIRLVGQVINNGVVNEASMHILFRTTDDELKDVIQDLKKLKAVSPVATSGMPLGIHPGFTELESRDARALAFGEAVRSFILKHAGQDNYFATSVMFTVPEDSAGVKKWFWAQYRRDPKTDRLMVVPTSGIDPGFSGDKTFSQLFAKQFDAEIVPPPAAALPQLKALFTKTPSAADVVSATAAASLLENPRLITIPQGDCASCHLAMTRRVAFESQFLATGAPESNDKFKLASNITTQLRPEFKALMLSTPNAIINFGYLKNKPVVSQRALNEAADAVDYVNRTMLGGSR